MLDERDMSQEKSWYYEQLAKRCIASFKKHNINAMYVPNRDEACAKVLGMIPDGATIGFADSVSVRQTGAMQELESNGKHTVFNGLKYEKWTKENYVPTGGLVENLLDEMRKALTADVFITGVNAVTLDGKLVSIDGLGNRVGGMIFGPKKVIIVTGANKIVEDADAAIKRIKNMAAPINSRRHHLKHGIGETPCAITGACIDCKHPFRECCITVIIEHAQVPPPGAEHRLNVILVGEELGI